MVHGLWVGFFGFFCFICWAVHSGIAKGSKDLEHTAHTSNPFSLCVSWEKPWITDEWVELDQELLLFDWRYRKCFWKLVMRGGDFLFLSPSRLITFYSLSVGSSVGCWFPSKIVNAGCMLWGRNSVSIWVSRKLCGFPHAAGWCRTLVRLHRK